jgi:hypothetical protein
VLNLLLIIGIGLEAWTCIQPKQALHPGVTRVFQSMNEKDGKRHVIVELPMGSRWGQWGWETKSLLTSTYHWQTVVNGVTGLWPNVQFQLGQELKEFPSSHTIALLQALDVDRIVLNEIKMRRRLPELLPRMQGTEELRFLRRIDRYSVWELAKGASRKSLRLDADFAIAAPSRLPVGQAGVSITVPQAVKHVIFNHKAPAHWKFPIAKSWHILDRISKKTTEWSSPGLFHARNSFFPLVVDITPAQKQIDLEMAIMDKKSELTRPIDVFIPQKTGAQVPTYLLLPPGFAEVSADQVHADLETQTPLPLAANPGSTVDFAIKVSNPGPFYWRSGKHNSVQLGVIVVVAGSERVIDFPLTHDLFPGDSVIQHLQMTLPAGLAADSVKVNCFGRGEGGDRAWFSEAGTLQIY